MLHVFKSNFCQVEVKDQVPIMQIFWKYLRFIIIYRVSNAAVQVIVVLNKIPKRIVTVLISNHTTKMVLQLDAILMVNAVYQVINVVDKVIAVLKVPNIVTAQHNNHIHQMDIQCVVGLE